MGGRRGRGALWGGWSGGRRGVTLPPSTTTTITTTVTGGDGDGGGGGDGGAGVLLFTHRCVLVQFVFCSCSGSVFNLYDNSSDNFSSFLIVLVVCFLLFLR